MRTAAKKVRRARMTLRISQKPRTKLSRQELTALDGPISPDISGRQSWDDVIMNTRVCYCTYGEHGSHAKMQGYLRAHKLKNKCQRCCASRSGYYYFENEPNGKNGEPIRRKSSTLTSLSSQENGLNNPFVKLGCFSSTIVLTVKRKLRCLSLMYFFIVLYCISCVNWTGLLGISHIALAQPFFAILD